MGAGGRALALLGYPALAIALPHKERPVNDLFNRQRESRGVVVVPTHQAIRRGLNALKNNEMIGVVADRDFTAKGEVFDFLGRKTLIPKGAAIFSARTGAPLLPVFLVREKDDTFTLIINDPIYPPQVSTKEMVDKEILLSIMEKYKSVLEDRIREYPTQWLMFREFWVN